MNSSLEPRSRFYDGIVYGTIIDPLLSGVRGFVLKHLPEGKRVLDACCGTGTLAANMANAGREVTGLDLSPRNVAYARKRHSRIPPELLNFRIGDVSSLEIPREGRYDVATIVMALHEMPADVRLPVLKTLLRVSKRVMVVDFAVPMPWNPAGFRNRAVEFTAGPEHFRAFLDFNRSGGLPALIRQAGTRTESERRIDSKTLYVAILGD